MHSTLEMLCAYSSLWPQGAGAEMWVPPHPTAFSLPHQFCSLRSQKLALRSLLWESIILQPPFLCPLSLAPTSQMRLRRHESCCLCLYSSHYHFGHFRASERQGVFITPRGDHSYSSLLDAKGPLSCGSCLYNLPPFVCVWERGGEVGLFLPQAYFLCNFWNPNIREISFAPF